MIPPVFGCQATCPFRANGRVQFQHNLPGNPWSGVVFEQMGQSLHVLDSGNDFCLIEAKPQDHPAWRLGGQAVLLVSVNGAGEVRWAISPGDIADFRKSGSSVYRKCDLEAVIDFFSITDEDLNI